MGTIAEWSRKTVYLNERCGAYGVEATPNDKTRKLLRDVLIPSTVSPLNAQPVAGESDTDGNRRKAQAPTKGVKSGLPNTGAYTSDAMLKSDLLDDINTIGPSRVSKRAGIGRRTIYSILNGATPRPATLANLNVAVRARQKNPASG